MNSSPIISMGYLYPTQSSSCLPNPNLGNLNFQFDINLLSISAHILHYLLSFTFVYSLSIPAMVHCSAAVLFLFAFSFSFAGYVLAHCFINISPIKTYVTFILSPNCIKNRNIFYCLLQVLHSEGLCDKSQLPSVGYFSNLLVTSGFMVDNLYYILGYYCLLYTSPSPRDATLSRMPSSA